MTVLGLLILVAWLAVAAVACLSIHIYQDGVGRKVTTDATVPCVIILPVRGASSDLAGTLRRLQQQDYPYWRLIFSVESVADPAHQTISQLMQTDPSRIDLVVAGMTVDTGQKMHNQLAALKHLRQQDGIVVFADADILPGPDWLTRIVRAVASPGVGVVSGYRWLIPENRNMAARLIAAGNQSVATLSRPRRLSHAWGGTMAMRREVLEQLGMERIWRGSALDDLPLSAAAKKAGFTVLSPRELLLPTEVDYGWRDGIAFARRQYLFVRLYQPGLWWFAALVTTIPTLGWCVAVPWALTGNPFALAAIVAVIAMDQFRAAMRRRVVHALWGEAMVGRLRDVLWLDRWATPLWMAFHSAIIWSTLFGKTIRWGGRTYRIDGRQAVRVANDSAAP
jgi:hypothetical protein